MKRKISYILDLLKWLIIKIDLIIEKIEKRIPFARLVLNFLLNFFN